MPIFVNGVDQGADIVNDTSPQLGGDLDANGSDITGVGHVGFLASQDASAGANDLDDYEEGSWTPTIQDDSLSDGEGQTYSVQIGRYTKIGNLVHFVCHVALSSLGCLTSTQNVRVAGLPFPSENVASLEASFSLNGFNLAITAGYTLGCTMEPNVSYLEPRLWDATTGVTPLKLSELSDDGALLISGSYRV